MEIKKNTLYGIGAALIILFGIISLSLSTSGEQTQQITGNNNAQVVKLWVNNGQYVFEPSSVKIMPFGQSSNYTNR